ncbi:hypothetical protein HG535_0B02220 [Zygotorulaspora mrakii]|uniref:Uncharacterized protein n=1 Tax=Zygotorulaspora mrakii TaxID=42260 RepID=A0A7H9AYI0_ZYGMR|nr:uncharacterized protein HG535_0B02220 [Zygotorulaspora mrakii]QLG71184.1 hypothetical protein HG535_0B02220 [Zygotorulaspora mrakii]
MVEKITWAQVGSSTVSGLLSPAFVTGSGSQLVFTSGCVGTDEKTGKLPSSIEDQARNAFLNLKTVLEKSGSSTDSILKVLLFLSDKSYAVKVNEIYKEFFPNQPARSCILVSFPNESLKVELECVAQVESKRKRWFKL